MRIHASAFVLPQVTLTQPRGTIFASAILFLIADLVIRTKQQESLTIEPIHLDRSLNHQLYP